MPLNCVAPKPENCSIQLMGALPVSTDPGDNSYMAYPIQAKAQSFLQHTINHITLKVSFSFSRTQTQMNIHVFIQTSTCIPTVSMKSRIMDLYNISDANEFVLVY